MAQTSVKLHPVAREALAALQARLDKEAGMTASREDIVGGLVGHTSPHQLLGMILTFKKDAAAYDAKMAEEAQQAGEDD